MQNGQAAYAQFIRSADPLLCPVSALAEYFYQRFNVAGECFPSVLDTKDW
jgi:sarcosine oxidase delta subunit